MEAGAFSAGRECCDAHEHYHGGGCCREKNSTFPSLSMALEYLQPEKQKERSVIEPIIKTLSDFVHNGVEILQNTNDKLLNRERKIPIATLSNCAFEHAIPFKSSTESLPVASHLHRHTAPNHHRNTITAFFTTFALRVLLTTSTTITTRIRMAMPITETHLPEAFSHTPSFSPSTHPLFCVPT